MKLLLICAGGMSTSILMKKLEKYAGERGVDFKVEARGVGDYLEVYGQYDVILLGPQVSYLKEKIAETTQMPLDTIPPYDYAIGNCANIFKQIEKLLSK